MDNVVKWLCEKEYMDRSEEDYVILLKNLKEKYGNLILKSTGELDNIKSSNANNEGTSIYNDDEESEVLELINKLDTQDIDSDTKQLREGLLDLCKSVLDIISDCDFDDKEQIENIKNFVDDTMLWVYIKEGLQSEDYKEKIDEINKMC